MSAKLTVYTTVIRPVLENANVIWDPHQKNPIQKLENVQRLSARYILYRCRRTDSVTGMLKQFDLIPLSERRRNARLKYNFMMYHGFFTIDYTLYWKPRITLILRNSHSKIIQPFQSRVNVFHCSLFPKTIDEWNLLPQEILNSSSPTQFLRRDTGSKIGFFLFFQLF